MTDIQTNKVSKFADDKTVAERRHICKSCEHSTSIGLCSKCGCVIYIKTLRSKQSCPVNKWNAISQ